MVDERRAVIDALKMPLPERSPEARAVIFNDDGSVSTERTMTIQAPNGAWVNVPQIIGGKLVSEDDATAAFLSGSNPAVTGEHADLSDAIAAARQRTQALSKLRGK